jgi:hypothetical protein
MRELLIRYLLGELDFHEQRQLEERLRTSPELERELAYLRTCFAAARDTGSDATELPRGLAKRTTQRVTDYDGEDESADAATPSRTPSRLSASEAPAGTLGWSLADLTVAGGVILAVGMLVFPALRDSREATRASICQNHLGELFVRLVGHAENNGGYFPQIGPYENAGMFAVRLVEGGYAGPEDLPLLLVCPGSPAAQKMRDGELSIQLPTTLQLAAMSPSDLMEARKNMSPCFAYTLPYRVGRQYIHRQDNRQPFPPILSDACGSEPGQSMSPNHNGFFQVLCGDGSVRVFVSRHVPGLGDDDLYRNERGQVAAGCSPSDTVLGPSEATPEGIQFISTRRRLGQ